MLSRTFKQILEDLEPIDNIREIILTRNGKGLSIIPNEEGKRGSLAVYAHLVGHKQGVIDAKRALYGLELFAEHTRDARENPGKHPNIDRLFEVLDGDYDLDVEIVYR